MNYVRRLCSKSKGFITLGQECNHRDGKISGLDPSHKTISNTEQPRAFIHHHSKLNTWECATLGNRDISAALWVTKDFNHPRIMLVSMYWESRERLIPEKLRELAEHCRKENIPILMGSDTNCSSTLANCTSTGPRGKELEDFLAQYGMNIANQGNSWTFFTTRKQRDESIMILKSIIDYTMTSTSIYNKIHSWEVSNEANESDQHTIKMKFTISTEPTIDRYDYKKADWNKFRQMISEETKEWDVSES